MKENILKEMIQENRLTYLFCLLSYPRKYTLLDNISYLIRLSFLVELSLEGFIDVDFKTNAILVSKRTDILFYREILNKIEKKTINFKKAPNALNGEFFSSKYANLNMKKLRKRVLIELKKHKLIKDFKIKIQNITVEADFNVKVFLNTKVINYLLNFNEENLLMDSLCILLELSGGLKALIEPLAPQQVEDIKSKLVLINKKIDNGSGINRPECLVYAFLRLAKK